MIEQLLRQKLFNADYIRLIERTEQQHFGQDERGLLQQILLQFDFDVLQEQALVQAVLEQARFNPWAGHEDDDEDGMPCPHCLNPPLPPLYDYQAWRKQS